MSGRHRRTAPPPGPQLQRIRKRLLAWFDRSKRHLPWRQTRDPYLVWLSEVMLQQTTVVTALPYFERFAARFPTLASLAAASEDEVLALWSGLGYYSRARNLRRGAQQIVCEHGGRFPSALDQALAIPGVGRYTAGAVLSICFDAPVPVVDGNVRRVLSRLFALAGEKWSQDGPYYALAQELLHPTRPGAWNEALMELGATVCTPRTPSCPQCPLRTGCIALEKGIVHLHPAPRKRQPSQDVLVQAALIREQGEVLLVRRNEGRLLGRLWELPQTCLDGRGTPELVQELRERYGLSIEKGPLAIVAAHAVTFRRIRLEGYEARLVAALPADPDRFAFASPATLSSYPVSSMTRKLIAGLTKRALPLKL